MSSFSGERPLHGVAYRDLARSFGNPPLDFVELARIDRDLAAWIEAHAWPGNVRELKNVVARACALAPKDARFDALPFLLRPGKGDAHLRTSPIRRCAPCSPAPAAISRSETISTPPAPSRGFVAPCSPVFTKT